MMFKQRNKAKAPPSPFMIEERASNISLKSKKASCKAIDTPGEDIGLQKCLSGSPGVRPDQRIAAEPEDNITRNVLVHIEVASKEMQLINQPESWKLNNGTLVFGRQSTHKRASIYIPIPQNKPFTISRLHCEILNSNGQVFITDLDSHFGTYINERPLGRSCEGLDTIELTAGRHLVSLGPPVHGHQFYITIETGE